MIKMTLGEVIDNMKTGEVAIKVEGDNGQFEDTNLRHTGSGIFFDEKDNSKLKNLEGGEISLHYGISNRDCFYIVPREVFEEIITNVVASIIEGDAELYAD